MDSKTNGNKVTERATVFLSYAREDEAIVQSAFKELLKAGFRPWFDRQDLLAGQEWKSKIRDAIRTSDLVVIFLSSTSVRKRGFVQDEIRETLEVLKEIPPGKVFAIPVRIDECDVPDDLQRYHCCDLFRDGMLHLVAAVTAAWADLNKDEATLLSETIRFREAQEVSEETAAVRLSEVLGRAPFIREAIGHLDRFGALTTRLTKSSKLKKASARRFCDFFLDGILFDGTRSFFIESGSSTAYLAQNFVTRLSPDAEYSFCTNNALALMDLTLRGFNVTATPSGPVDSYYGATYGPIGNLYLAPDTYHQEPSSAVEQKVLMTTGEEISKAIGKKGFLFISASLMLPEHNDVLAMRVGSYSNRLLKRALLSTGYPVAFLIDGSKWWDQIEERDLPKFCFDIFDDFLTFSQIFAQSPSVIISSFSDLKRCYCFLRYLEHMTTDFVRILSDHSGIFTVAFANKSFIDRFDQRRKDEWLSSFT